MPHEDSVNPESTEIKETPQSHPAAKHNNTEAVTGFSSMACRYSRKRVFFTKKKKKFDGQILSSLGHQLEVKRTRYNRHK